MVITWKLPLTGIYLAKCQITGLLGNYLQVETLDETKTGSVTRGPEAPTQMLNDYYRGASDDVNILVNNNKPTQQQLLILKAGGKRSSRNMGNSRIKNER